MGNVKQRSLTLLEAMKELNEIRAIPIKVCNRVIWRRTDIVGNAVFLFRAPGVAIPAKVLKAPSKCSGTK